MSIASRFSRSPKIRESQRRIRNARDGRRRGDPVIPLHPIASPPSKSGRRIESVLASWAIVAIVLALGCASTETKTPKAEQKPIVTSDGLVQVVSTPRSRLWVKPDHYIGRYDDILIKQIGFDYGRGQEPLDEQEEEEIGKMLVDAVTSFTESGHIGRADEPGPCVVSLSLGLRDLYVHTSNLHPSDTSGSNVSYVGSFGAATMVVEFRDSLTDTPLVRYMSHRGLGEGGSGGRRDAGLKRLGRALGKMVTNMTTELQEIVPNTTVRGESECNDGIYKLTGRG